MTASNIINDKGYKWVVLGTYMVIAAVSQLLWLNFAPITTPIMTSLFKVSEESVGLLADMWPLIFIPISIPAGIITDKRGFRFAVLLGALIMAIFSTARIFAGTNFFLLLIFQSLAGVGQPFVYAPISKMVIEWFEPKERGLATGLAVLGQFVGFMSAMVFTPMLVPTPNFALFQRMLIIYSLISILSFILFLVFAKERAIPINERELIVSSFGNVKGVLKVRDFVILSVLFFIGIGYFTGLLTWLESMLVPRGINVIMSGLISGILVIGGMIGLIVIPSLSDRLRRRKPFLLIDLGVSAVLIYILAVSYNPVVLSASSFLLGFFLVSALPIGLDYTAQLVGPSIVGTIQSILWLIGEAGAVVLIPVMGSLVNYRLFPTNPFFPSMIFVMILDIISFILCIFLRERSG